MGRDKKDGAASRPGIVVPGPEMGRLRSEDDRPAQDDDVKERDGGVGRAQQPYPNPHHVLSPSDEISIAWIRLEP